VGARRLTLLRHAQAQPHEHYAEDFERPLTRRGDAEAREMGNRIVQRGLVPDLILASPAERTWATAQIIAAACELDQKQLLCARELYQAPAEIIMRLICARAAGVHHVLVCGHNPGISHLASRLGPKPEPRDLSTAGLASALWNQAAWHGLEPETADACELDDPESMTEPWA
jgi:phosphohistidine phosphatase